MSSATATDGGSGDLLERTAALVLPRYFLWNRVAVRIAEAVTLVATGRDGHGLGVAAAAVCAAYDIGLARVLMRSRLPVGLRLALDSLDVAAWSLVIGHVSDAAAMAAAPLSLELGVRNGWRGLAAPVVIGGVTSALFLAAGQRLEVGPFLWPLVGVLVGMLIIAYLGRNLARKLDLAAQQTEAAASQADLAGQNSIAMGADTVVDLLARTASLVGLAGARAAASPLAAWRAALAEASVTRATYLGVAVARWQRRRNSMSPDLSADVELRCLGASGTLLLSSAQARHLEQALDRLPLRDEVSIEVRSPAPAGRAQLVLVGRRRVLLPADPAPPGPALDLGPIAFVLGGILSLSHSLPWFEAVPLAVTVPLAAAAGSLAWWSHRRLERLGSAAHASVLGAALALGAADALLSTVTMRNAMTGGLERQPSLLFLLWVGPLTVVYLRDLARWQRPLAIGTAAAIALAGIGLHLGAAAPVQLLTVPLWPAMAVLTSIGLRDMLELDTAEIRRHFQLRHRRAVEEAYRRGRQLVVDLAAAAATDTRETFTHVRDELDSPLAAEVERRLADVEHRLGALRLAV